VLLTVLAGCVTSGPEALDFATALDLPPPELPEGARATPAMAELGRHLFFDERLSIDGTYSCASCHDPARAFSDGRAQAIGVHGDELPRNSPGLANVAWLAPLTWANDRLNTLEAQAIVPMLAALPAELGIQDATDEVLARLQADPAMRARIEDAFGSPRRELEVADLVAALAMFERTLISDDAPWDRYLAGDPAAVDASVVRGAALFASEELACAQCHAGPLLTDAAPGDGAEAAPRPFHNTGLYNIGGTGAFPQPNRGVFELTARAEDMGRFRAPSLRNVEVTAPYMHDGSVATLTEVLRFYAAGGRNLTTGPFAGDGRANPFKSELVSRIDLSEQEQADIVEFLKTLTDHEFLSEPRLADPFAAR
jgi:cytochrome c peroxidase